jgi:hypothetical protein
MYNFLCTLDVDILEQSHGEFESEGRTIRYSSALVKLDDKVVKLKVDPDLKLEAGKQTVNIGFNVDQQYRPQIRIIKPE